MLWKIAFFYYFILSIITGVMHLWDKNQAVRGKWRVQEKTLHSFEFLGGWPGAFLAMRTVNHKLAKRKYMLVFYASIVSHVIGWMLMMWWATH